MTWLGEIIKLTFYYSIAVCYASQTCEFHVMQSFSSHWWCTYAGVFTYFAWTCRVGVCGQTWIDGLALLDQLISQNKRKHLHRCVCVLVY